METSLIVLYCTVEPRSFVRTRDVRDLLVYHAVEIYSRAALPPVTPYA